MIAENKNESMTVVRSLIQENESKKGTPGCVAHRCSKTRPVTVTVVYRPGENVISLY